MPEPRRAPARNDLLAAVDRLRPLALAHADDAERRRTLSPPVIDALHASGLFAMATPRALGGAECDPLTQFEIIEAMTHADTAAGWSLMIGSVLTGLAAAYLPERGTARIFADHRPVFAGLQAPSGVARRAPGGYRVSGRWAFGSGVRHASWIFTPVALAPDDGAPALLAVAVPIERVVIEDTWDTAGLRGSGSDHYRLDDVFVEDDFVCPFPAAPVLRGGPAYQLPFVAYTTPSHTGFVLGAARRALDEIRDLAPKRLKLWPMTPLGAHPAFHMDLGRAEAKLAAARAFAIEVIAAMWDRALAGDPLTLADWARVRLATTYGTEIAAEVTSFAYHAGGGGALYATSPLQRYFRDVHAATQHISATDDAYEFLGKVQLGIAEPHLLYTPRPAG